MRMLFIIFGSLLLAQTAVAINPPQIPQVNSSYVREVLNSIRDNLDDKASSDSASGTDYEEKLKKLDAARRFRLLFELPSGMPEGIPSALRDIERTPCFVHDLRAMERVLVELMDLSLKSAEDLNSKESQHYYNAAQLLWKRIWQVRSFALDPDVQISFGTGGVVGDPPSGANAMSDDAICPYTSSYAPTGVGYLGCNSEKFNFYSQNRVITDEADIIRDIILSMGNDITGLASELMLYRNDIQSMRENSMAFIRNLHRSGAPLSFKIIQPALIFFIAKNAGESGCRGWPSDADTHGTVSGKDLHLQNTFPDVLTRDLANAFLFLKIREEPKWQEYVRNLLEGESNPIGTIFSSESLDDINREHVARESHLILSLRDPQIRMANLADVLHEQTRKFAGQAVNISGESSRLPPLRRFIADFATFLLGMCQNHGCSDTLLRAYELRLRDECFPSFSSTQFFQANPDAATLPICNARYVDQ